MSNKIYKYDLQNKEWKVSSHQMSEAVAEHSCLYLQNKIIVVGGFRKCFGCEVRTEIFDLHKQSRKYGGKLPIRITHATMLESRLINI